jgi:dephospho-CoA kinase
MRIGITGGIGSGKSYVSHLLTAHYSIPVYDSDREARRLMVASESIREGLVRLIGREAYSPSGELCKAVVADYLFSAPSHATAVNAIVHPAVKTDFLQWAERQRGVVAFESAILVEAGFRDVVDCLMVVSASEELRLQRAMERDGAEEKQIRDRMARQCSEAERLQAADFVVMNDGRDLMPQLEEFVHYYIYKDKNNA